MLKDALERPPRVGESMQEDDRQTRRITLLDIREAQAAW
jgi:hypothetical protein